MLTREKLREPKAESKEIPKEDKEKSVNFNSKISVIENFLSSRYQFQFNSIKGISEWRPLNSSIEFEVIDDYKLNSIYRECELNGIPASTDKLHKILQSEFVPRVNPIQRYFKDLDIDSVNRTEHLEELISTIKTTNDFLFPEYFKKWIVACVANVMIRDGCQNHTCLVLTGSQGRGKTTWLDNLCPQKLKRGYLFTGKINAENKDSIVLLAECFLLNIDDQLRNLNKQDENSLKTLITQTSVKVRKAYARMITEHPRIASFMGSVNGNDFLTDPTGSRRFLPFEVTDINIEAAKKVNMDKVWAEAYKLFKEGFKYWFSEEDMEELNKNNEAFQVESMEYELLNNYFSPGKGDKDTVFLQSSIIQVELQEYSKSRLSQKKLGEALKKMGIERCQRNINGKKTWGYLVNKKSYEEREAQHKSIQAEPEEDLPF